MSARVLDRLPAAATVLAVAASVLAYPWLPARMPVHFDLAGQPDGFASRAVGAFLLPGIMAVVVAARLVPRLRGGGRRALVMGFVTVLLSGFFLGLHVLVLRAAISGGPLGGALWLLCGALFVALGLVLPRVPRNRWVGIRTPWSMRSPEAWARTHRGGSYLIIAMGVLLALSATLPGAPALALRAFAFLAGMGGAVAWSWWAARTASPRRDA